jgi:hypothetical protein
MKRRPFARKKCNLKETWFLCGIFLSRIKTQDITWQFPFIVVLYRRNEWYIGCSIIIKWSEKAFVVFHFAKNMCRVGNRIIFQNYFWVVQYIFPFYE